MIEAIATVKSLIFDRNERSFAPTKLEQFALERSIEVVSEASRHLSAEIKSITPEVPWRDIAGIGNIIRHDYHKVRAPILAGILFNDFPRLETSLRSLRAILENASTAPGPSPS